MTTCGGIKLAVSWERQDNRRTKCEVDYMPKKEESTDGVGSALCTRPQLGWRLMGVGGRMEGNLESGIIIQNQN